MGWRARLAMAMAALLVLLAASATARAAEPEPGPTTSTHAVRFPPLFARFGLGVTVYGGRAGLAVAGRAAGRFGIGGQAAAFTYSTSSLTHDLSAWLVAPFGAVAVDNFLFTAGAGYAQARQREHSSTAAYRGISVNGGLHWLGSGGIGLALCADGIADPSGGVPFDGAVTLNLELGPPA